MQSDNEHITIHLSADEAAILGQALVLYTQSLDLQDLSEEMRAKYHHAASISRQVITQIRQLNDSPSSFSLKDNE